MRRIFLCIIILLLLSLNMYAQSIVIDSIQYSVNTTNKTEACAYIRENAPSNVIIAEKVKIKGRELTVSHVNVYAKFLTEAPFFENTTLESIVLPSTITGGNLNCCSNLKKVILSEGMKTIPPCFFENCKGLKTIDLPKSITNIGQRAFALTGLESVVIPNTVKSIGEFAFEGCEGLKNVVLPDEEWREIEEEEQNGGEKTVNSWGRKVVTKNQTWDNLRVFRKSVNIENVQGHNFEYPQYLKENYKRIFDTESPFFKKISKIENTYSFFAKDVILEKMKEWQQKDEFETTLQWQNRVTATKQKAQLEIVKEYVKHEYIKKYAPKTIDCSIGNFDADNSVFPVKIRGTINSFYVQVPQKNAQEFKTNWDNVVIKPEYGIIDNQLGVLECTFSLKGKTYKSTNIHSNYTSEKLEIELPPIDLNIDYDATIENRSQQMATVDNSVDLQIPSIKANNDKTFAVIIGNENYQRVSKVDCANNDAKVFAEYCHKTLGIPTKNVRSYYDATYGTMLAALKDIKSIAEAYKGDLNVILYYAGHGVPDGTGKAYLLPVDADGSQVEVCLATSKLYKELNALHARSVVVFMDACFSGAKRGEGMIMAARGVALKAKSDVPEGNCVVFSAANGEETAFPYKEKGHGLFTYFLLKKLQETKGDVTLGELGEYIQTNVRQQSVVVNRKPQTPSIIPSASANNWKTMKLK